MRRLLVKERGLMFYQILEKGGPKNGCGQKRLGESRKAGVKRVCQARRSKNQTKNLGRLLRHPICLLGGRRTRWSERFLKKLRRNLDCTGKTPKKDKKLQVKKSRRQARPEFTQKLNLKEENFILKVKQS